MIGKILFAAFLSLVGSRALAQDNPENWCADYKNENGKGLHRIVIRKDKSDIKIHAYANAFPDDIDWGEVTADVYPTHISCFLAKFKTKQLGATLVIEPNSGGGIPNGGGLIHTILFLDYTDGRPRECVIANFDSYKMNSK